MKKKIKDLTIEEAILFCNQQIEDNLCMECIFGTRFGCPLSPLKRIKKDLEIEVEIDEEKN